MSSDWATFFSKKEYEVFISIINDYFKKKKISMTIEDGIAITPDSDIGQFGLLNIAQQCRQQKKKEWKIIIKTHFDNMFKMKEFEVEFSKKKDDFDSIKEYIATKIYHQDYISQIGGKNALFRSLMENVAEVLVFDLPRTIRNISPEEIDKWDISIDELYEIGRANVKKHYQFDISKNKVSNIEIWQIISEDLFTTNAIFDIDEKIKWMGAHGSLVGIPTRHLVLIFPIESLEVVQAINIIIPIIYTMEKEGPGSISNLLYWYIDGKFITLPYSIKNKKIDFYPPPTFVDELNKLKK